MHLSENEGIEGKTFLVTGGLGFVGSALCFELVRRGAYQVRAFDIRSESPWYVALRHRGVHCVQGKRKESYTCVQSVLLLYTAQVKKGTCIGIIKLAKLGLLPFRIGDTNVKSDWVYVDNIVLAKLQASMGLLDDIPGRVGRPVAAGQAFFIADGSPVNSFEFLRPLLGALDYGLPKLTLPVSQALYLGKLFSVFYSLLYPCLNQRWLPQPLILPAEVYKVGVTHYFSFLKAKEEMGYWPLISSQEGMAATIEYWKERKRRSLDGPTICVWVAVVIGMTMMFCAAFLPDFGPVPLIRAICLFFLRSRTMIRAVFTLAVAVHIGEGVHAWQLARRCDPANAAGWFWQTTVLGFFSLRYLLKRAEMQPK